MKVAKSVVVAARELVGTEKGVGVYDLVPRGAVPAAEEVPEAEARLKVEAAAPRVARPERAARDLVGRSVALVLEARARLEAAPALPRRKRVGCRRRRRRHRGSAEQAGGRRRRRRSGVGGHRQEEVQRRREADGGEDPNDDRFHAHAAVLTRLGIFLDFVRP